MRTEEKKEDSERREVLPISASLHEERVGYVGSIKEGVSAGRRRQKEKKKKNPHNHLRETKSGASHSLKKGRFLPRKNDNKEL